MFLRRKLVIEKNHALFERAYLSVILLCLLLSDFIVCSSKI